MADEIANAELVTVEELLVGLGLGSPAIAVAKPSSLSGEDLRPVPPGSLSGEDLRPVPPGSIVANIAPVFHSFTSTETRLPVTATIPFESESEVFSAKDINLSLMVIKKLSSALAKKTLNEHLFSNVGSYYVSQDRKYIVFYGFKKVGEWTNAMGTQGTRVTVEKNAATVIGRMVRNNALVGGIVLSGAAVFDFIVNVATSDDPLSADAFRDAFKKTTMSVAGSLVTTSAGIAVKAVATKGSFWLARKWGWGVVARGVKLVRFLNPIDAFLITFLHSPELNASDEQLLLDAMAMLRFRLGQSVQDD